MYGWIGGAARSAVQRRLPRCGELGIEALFRLGGFCAGGLCIISEKGKGIGRSTRSSAHQAKIICFSFFVCMDPLRSDITALYVTVLVFPLLY